MAAEQDQQLEAKARGPLGAFEPMVTFLRESWQEVRYKVTWPSKKEVVGTTQVVLIATLIFATYLFALDWMMMFALEKIWGQAR